MLWGTWLACRHLSTTGPAPNYVQRSYQIDWGRSGDGRQLQFWVTELIPWEDRPVELIVDYNLVGADVAEMEWTEGPFPMDRGGFPVFTWHPPIPLTGRPFYVGGAIRQVLADGSQGFSMGIPSAYVWSGPDGLPRVAPEWWVTERCPPGPNGHPLSTDLSTEITETYVATPMGISANNGTDR